MIKNDDTIKNCFIACDEQTQKSGLCSCNSNNYYNNSLDLMETINKTPSHPQVQYDLERQLKELRLMANKLGLYDASDFLRPFCG